MLDLDRRAFLLSALAAGLLSPRRAIAAAPLSDVAVLNRLTFGATPALRAEIAERGRQAWIEAQLAMPPDHPDLAARLAAARLRLVSTDTTDSEGRPLVPVDRLLPLSALGADPAESVPLLDWEVPRHWAERVRPAEEVIAASLVRAVHAPAQLREVMTQFWHDHFNVQSQKDEGTAAFFPPYDAGLRAGALGNFRALLQHVATSPAMLIYLTNADSRASPANENFARELLDLHTLGTGAYLNDRVAHWSQVPGAAAGLAAGYLDDDVYEVARAFTGWTVGDGRWVNDGETTPKDGRFAYVEAWHDPYQKRFLGREFPDHAGPMADGMAVLDLLATHPGTARFICAKLARRFLADDPDPAVVERLAQVFLDRAQAPDQIAQVIRALTGEPAFAAQPAKLRRPFEVLAALLRATGAEVTATGNAWHWQLRRAGWHQHTYPPPTGHPDRAEDWVSGTLLLRLAEYALFAHEDWFGVTGTRLDAAGAGTVAEAADFWSARLTGQAAPLSEALEAVGRDPAEPWPDDPQQRHDLSAVLVAAAAMSPAFLYR